MGTLFVPTIVVHGAMVIPRQRGYTLTELVITLVILGVLSAVAAPRFMDRGAFEDRGFSDQVVSALRYAQKLAVATGCEVQVSVAGGSYTLNQRITSCDTGAFTRAVSNPGSGETQYTATAPAGVGLSATASPIVFNALGQASSATQVTTGGRIFQIVAETGLVYRL